MTALYTKDIPDRFFAVLEKECAHRGFDPVALLSVMFSESGCYAHAQNPNGKATGILQFMPAILKGLGWNKGDEAFRHLDAAQQLPFVFAYFVPWQKFGAPWDSAQRIYQATFLPATLSQGKTDDFVLCARGGKLGWAYDANAGFDRNGDKVITLGELGQAIKRNCKGPRWAELLERLTGLPNEDAKPSIDLGTVSGVQYALASLGYYTGNVDGIRGPMTIAAIRSFQQASDLAVDGIYGPNTRAALEAATRSGKTDIPTPPSTEDDLG